MTAAVKTVKQPALLLPSEAGITLPGSGNTWIDSVRSNAADQFITHGLPTIHDEEWRYTDIRKLKRHQFSVSSNVSNVSKILSTLPDYGLFRIVLVNGFFAPENSTGSLPAGVTVSSLASRLERGDLEGLIGSSLPIDLHGFTALNSAYCLDGAVIEIADNAIIEKPIELVHVTTSSETAVVSHPRNLIIVGKLSEAQVIERSLCSDSSTTYLNNTVTEIIAADGAQLEHYKVQQDSKNAFHIGGVFANQNRDSNVTNHNVALGGGLVRNDIHLNLLGTGSHAGMNGLVVGHGTQHVHNHTEVAHRVPHCTSDEFYKTVLDDKSRSIFRGRIIVAQDAQKTSAEQQNNNLLLSADAEANTKPQLEIYADDVICSHGATIGQLDAKSLFYFQSRGITKEDARRLLTFAFVNEVLDRIKFEPLQAELTERFLGELLPDTYQEVFA
jgi:Fe-S cluster assembly protein SufD